MQPILINICAPSFSGTTILDLMLGNAANGFSCGEVAFWFRPHYDYHTRIECPCIDEGMCPIWRTLARVPEHRFHETACRELQLGHIVDSSKKLTWVIDANRWAEKSGMHAVNLLVWKTPIALAHSYWKRGRSLSVPGLRYARYYKRFIELGLPFAAVNFHRLTKSPAEQLQEICRYSLVPYFEGKEQFWTKQHHHLFGSEGTRNQLGQEKNSIRAEQQFPTQFLDAFEEFEEKHGLRAETDAIQQILEANDVTRAAASDSVAFSASKQMRLPWWYYRQRAKDWLRWGIGRIRIDHRAA